MTPKRQAKRTPQLAAVGLLLLAGCASRPAPQAQPTPNELAPPLAPAPAGPLTLNTSIEAICATRAGKAVLDRDLPGLTTRPEFAMFKGMTLKQLQPMSKGHLTDATLAKVASDLAALNTKTAGR